MTASTPTISELANSILLDDVTDVFYRSIVFSNVQRCGLDVRTDTEKKLDAKLEIKLARQLNWSTVLTSLEPATHRLSHFVKLVLTNRLTEIELASAIEENYWLQAAIDNGQPKFSVANQTLVEQFNDNAFLMEVCFQTLYLQTSDSCRGILQQVFQLSKQFVEINETDSHTRNELYRLAILNIYPMFVLIKLFDRNLQSMIQDELNTLPFECEQQREKVKQYRPCAETVLNFLVFDEFVKPHVLESLNLNSGLLTNLVVDESKLNTMEARFLAQRKEVIVTKLKEFQILTMQQLQNNEQQLGIDYQLSNLDKLNKKYLDVLAGLVGIQANKPMELSF